MMRIKVASRFICLAVLALMNIAAAEQCFEESAALQRQGDAYYNTDKSVELSKSEIKQLNKFFESLEGRWKGSLIQLDCDDRSTDRNVSRKNAEVTAEIEYFSGKKSYLKVTADAHFRKNRISKNIKNEPLRHGGIFLFQKSGGGFKFSEKYRSRSSRGSIFVEDIYEISSSRKSMNINIKKYHSGAFVLEEKWKLNRR